MGSERAIRICTVLEAMMMSNVDGDIGTEETKAGMRN